MEICLTYIANETSGERTPLLIEESQPDITLPTACVQMELAKD